MNSIFLNLIPALMPVLFSVNVSATDDITNYELKAQGIPIGEFLKTAFNSPERFIKIDSKLNDFNVDGVYEGDELSIITTLADEYNFTFTSTPSALTIWKDRDFFYNHKFNLVASDTPLIQLVTVLADTHNLHVDADASIDVLINGEFNGTLLETLSDLSFKHSLLAFINDTSVSIVSEDRHEQAEVPIEREGSLDDWLIGQNVDDLLPGNHIDILNDKAVIGGHPNFVALASLQAKSHLMNLPTIQSVSTVSSDVILPPVPELAQSQSDAVDSDLKTTTELETPTLSKREVVSIKTVPTKIPSSRGNSDFLKPLEAIPGFY